MEAVGEPAYYLAEWYLPELTEQSVDEIVARLDAAAAACQQRGHARAPARHALGAD